MFGGNKLSAEATNESRWPSLEPIVLTMEVQMIMEILYRIHIKEETYLLYMRLDVL